MNPIATLAASALWSSINRVARPILSRRRFSFGPPVISVGNLEAGGTGKTPVVALLIRKLRERGMSRLLVLSRGYGRTTAETLVVSPQIEALPSQVGDEPALLRLLEPSIWLAIGSDRRKAFAQAQQTAKQGFDAVILDDGFQQFGLARSADLLLCTSSKPWEKVFREWPGGALFRSATQVLWTKGSEAPWGAPSGVDRVSFEWSALEGQLYGGPYFWISGIADAERGKKALMEAGFDIRSIKTLADHHAYTDSEVRQYLAQAQSMGLRTLLGGKDWIKWKALGVSRSEVDVIEPRAVWQGVDRFLTEAVKQKRVET